MSELDDLEKLYEVNIQVYSLAPTQSHSEDEDNEENTPEIAATLLRRSHRHYSSTLYLNLYENHFSYIKDLARYSKSFCCSRCGKYWKRASNLRQHEKTCDGKVQLKYPGGAYHVPKTIFEELEDEGIVVPEEWRYFPYRATYDFECYFDKEKAQELKNTEKLNWESAHVPLSVSVCSNVPGYQAPKCFVSNGDPNVFITEFMQYLTKISLKSSSILREQFAPVFEALKHIYSSLEEECMFQKEVVKYPVVRDQIRSFTFNGATTVWTQDNLFLNRVPQRMIVGILDSTAFNGAKEKYPFAFQSKGVTSIRQFIEGEEYPYVTLEFAGNNTLKDWEGYRRFLDAAGSVAKHREFMVKPGDWGHNKNCTLYMWNNVPSGNADGPKLNPKQTGNVRLEIKFRAALNANITILVWGEFESVIYIDHLGAVTYDNKV